MFNIINIFNFQLKILFREHVNLPIILATFITPLVLLLINSLLYKKYILSRNKPRAFECGFDTILPARTPFSLKFYLISIIFLIFDIEIALLLPIPLIPPFSHSLVINYLILLFLIVLFLGLIIE